MPSEQLDMLVQMLRARPAADGAPIERIREFFEKESQFAPVADDVTCEPVEIGGVHAEWIAAPGASDDRIIFYLHGGGYNIGSLDTHREMVSRLARAAQARAVSVEYRLAPENPHPAALEDSIAAYRGLLSDGADPARIVIGGDSAGGGLTIATLVALRDQNERLPAAALCLSPWTDLALTGESMKTKVDVDPMITVQGGKMMAGNYAGEADVREPLISPLYAELSGLPPMLIQVGTLEMLLDDSTRFADKAREAGVDVILEPWEDMIHVWQFFASMLPEGQQAIDRIGEFVRQHIL